MVSNYKIISRKITHMGSSSHDPNLFRPANNHSVLEKNKKEKEKFFILNLFAR